VDQSWKWESAEGAANIDEVHPHVLCCSTVLGTSVAYIDKKMATLPLIFCYFFWHSDLAYPRLNLSMKIWFALPVGQASVAAGPRWSVSLTARAKRVCCCQACRRQGTWKLGRAAILLVDGCHVRFFHCLVSAASFAAWCHYHIGKVYMGWMRMFAHCCSLHPQRGKDHVTDAAGCTLL